MLLSLVGHVAGAQESVSDSISTNRTVHTVWMSAGVDYVASSFVDDVLSQTASEVKIRTNTSVPINLRYSFSINDNRIKHYLPGGYQGFGIGLLNPGAAQRGGVDRATQYIGYPVLLYVFQGGPVKKLSERLSLDYEWNFGASFGWKPYGDENKMYNLIVGSRVNAYLNVGLNLSYKLNENSSLFGGIALTHFSNGNTSFPNPGVNSLGVRIGAKWTINPPRHGFEPLSMDTVSRRKLQYDIMAWGATRKRVYRGGENPVLLPGHFACAGLSFAPMYCVGRWWRFGGALDLQWDRSSDLKRYYIGGATTEDIRFETPPFWNQTSVGISAHAELRMPIFAVNVGCGYNLLAPIENRGTYQNIALKTYLGETIFLNIGYQLRNFHQQSSLMLGAGVTI